MTRTPLAHASRRAVVLAFVLLYLFGGSKFLGIRFAVEHIPPALLGALRFGIAGAVMLAVCPLTGRRIAVDRTEFSRLLTLGILMLTLGNVVLFWAQQVVPSGVAALIVSSVPLWMLVIDRVVFGGTRPPLLGMVGLATGALGIVVLLWPKLSSQQWSGDRELFAAGTVLFSALMWALGSVLATRWKGSVDPFVATAWQMTTAGVVSLLLAVMLGELGRVTWETRSVLALAYLIVAGSWINFTAYIWLLQHVAASKVSTYAYVNPVLALFLGWLIAGEQITGFTAAGACIVISAVALVTTAKTAAAPRLREDGPVAAPLPERAP